MIPSRLSALRTLVIWVLAAYAAVLSVGAGQTQFSPSQQRSEAFARDAHLQIATLRSFVEFEAPADPDGEWPAGPSAGFRVDAPSRGLLIFPAPSQGGAISCLPPTPTARGPPRHS